MEFDYIIVGAGASGCVVASRLSEDPGVRVCLVEAGPHDTSPAITLPSAFMFAAQDRRFNWGYRTEAEGACASRTFPFPQGKVLGGTTSINGMVYIRGHRTDFDDWEAAGNAGWGYDAVLPYFVRSENNHRWSDSPYHGNAGPVDISDPAHISRLSQAFVDAAVESGLPACDDFNGSRQDGAGIRQLFQRRGRRVSSATAFLKPNRHRQNLTILTGAKANRLLISGKTCTGIEVFHGGEKVELTSKLETIVSCGALGSPILLQRSGIGDASKLRAAGVEPIHNLPEVGRNFQDHVGIATRFANPNSSSYGLSLKWLFKWAAAPADLLMFGRGLLTTNFAYASAFLRSSNSEERPDIQLILWSVHRPPGRLLGYGHSFAIVSNVLRPKSRGSVMIGGPSPDALPVIETGLLSHQDDVNLLIEGIRRSREVAAMPSLTSHCGPELSPSQKCTSAESLERYVRENASPGLHAGGTCRMGSDASAVVDPDLRVKGVAALRVADSSIMPTIIGGNTAAPCIMIGEKVSDLIREKRKRLSGSEA